MKLFFFFLLPLVFCLDISAIHVNNPAYPSYFQQGLFYKVKKKPAWGIKTSVFYDNIYKGRYEDEFKTINSNPANIEMSTIGAALYFNMRNRLDVVGYVGYSQMRLDKLYYTHRCPSYGGGGSLLLLKTHNIYLTIDAKYFRTDQKSDYFLCDGQIAPIIGDFELQYEEIQGALTLGYEIEFLIPYIGMTYLYSSIDPSPPTGILQIPGTEYLVDFHTSRAVTRRNWGMLVGCSLVDNEMMSLTLESRFFDQNAYHVSGTFRF